MPLNIVINADYRITSDSLNVIVNRRFIVDPTKAPNWSKREAEGADPTPREEWREVGYSPTIEKALTYIVDQTVRDSNAQTITELVADVTRIKREIKAVLTR